MASYHIDKENYHTFEIYEINKLLPRSFAIPYASAEAEGAVDLLRKRYASDKVRCLNGTWDFRFYANPAQIPDVLDTQATRFDEIDVPSCWQMRGYDRPFYVNTRLPFPFRPPVIPKEERIGKAFCWIGSDRNVGPRFQGPREDEYNFAGIYRKTFAVSAGDGRRILSFLGVAGALDVYVNGQHVGYSEVAHCVAEFDVTRYVSPGDNELVAVVRRFSNGSYLECQDMFRHNGIFRDVLLYELNERDFWDVDFKAKKGPKGYQANLSAVMTRDCEVTFTIKGHGLEISRTVATQGKKASVSFPELDVAEWNAEEPVLYDAYYETKGSCIHKRVGFKQVAIKYDVFFLNGSKVKLRGVNHHDTHPKNGFTMTPEEIERDVLLCKEYNIDTIRTSHYPPDPLLIELCNEYGIYVVDECDLETHAAFSMQFPPTYNTLTQNRAWLPRYMDRIRRLYGRDKGNVCIVMWSLGNESGGYRNTDAMYAWLKTVTDIPVHYESVIHSRRRAYDVASEMYPGFAHFDEVAAQTCKTAQLNNRPYFLCEYGHAMGVGPGNMERYWNRIYEHDNLMGGCIWEMVDHAIAGEDGVYAYGGDHKEWMHDGNFCVDGLFYQDRTPSTGARMTAFIYRPIRVRLLQDDGLEIFNTMNFSASDRYELRARINDGEQHIVAHDVGPLSKAVVACPWIAREAQDMKKAFLNVQTFDRKQGRIVATEQICIRNAETVQKQLRSAALPDGFDVEGFRPRFGGILAENERRTPYTLLFRAPTDNDRTWFGGSVTDPFIDGREELLSCFRTDREITVRTKLTFPKHEFICIDRYQGCDRGVLVTSTLHCVRGKGSLVRFAKVFPLEAGFADVAYFGRERESYCDMKDYTPIASVRARLEDMTEPNIRPQESGNRCDVSEVTLSDKERKITFTAIGGAFELGIKPYSDTELLSMRHTSDEHKTGVYVAVNAFQQGIGTGSCGPATAEEFLYPVNRDYRLKFLISTATDDKDRAGKWGKQRS